MTRAGYAREWARFTDWCTATGRTALPATSETVLAYLHDEQPTGGTAARWVAAIRAAHQPTGTDPCAGPVAAWVRSARGGRPVRAPAPDTLTRVLRGVPTTGWPVGVFGRRDRLVYLLHRAGGLPVRTLVALRVADLSVPAPGCVQVPTGGAGTLTVQVPGADPMACPACAAVSWLDVLAHETAHGWRALAAHLTGAQADPDHVCDQRAYDPSPGLGAWPVFPAVNRWGHLPAAPVPAMSTRALAEVLRRVQRGVSTHATVPLRPPQADSMTESADLSPVDVPPVTATPVSSTTWHRDGISARARARASLDDVTGRLDDLLAGIDEWEARVEQVMQTVAAFQPGPFQPAGSTSRR